MFVLPQSISHKKIPHKEFLTQTVSMLEGFIKMLRIDAHS